MDIASLKMEGKEVFKEAVKVIQSNSLEAIESANLNPNDIDLFIPHQANMRIIEAARKGWNFLGKMLCEYRKIWKHFICFGFACITRSSE